MTFFNCLSYVAPNDCTVYELEGMWKEVVLA